MPTRGQRVAMHQCDDATFPACECDTHGLPARAAASRRDVPKASVALATGAGTLLPAAASVQSASAADSELAALQGKRRILIRGGVVLTLDRGRRFRRR